MLPRRINNLVDDGTDLHDLCSAGEVQSARTLLAVAEKIRDIYRKETEEKPMRCDSDLRKDVIYRLGLIEGLNTVIDLPRQAKQYIHNLPKGD